MCFSVQNTKTFLLLETGLSALCPNLKRPDFWRKPGRLKLSNSGPTGSCVERAVADNLQSALRERGTQSNWNNAMNKQHRQLRIKTAHRYVLVE